MKKSLSFRIIHAALALVPTSLAWDRALADEPPPALRSTMDAAIIPLMKRDDIPGMAVALAVEGKAYLFNYGVASRQAGTPVSDSTLFELGSVTKTLTATLATYAEATGRLSLSDHPGRYVSRLKGRPLDQSTLVDLGTFTAGGLPLQFPDEVADSDDAAIGYLAAWDAAACPVSCASTPVPASACLGMSPAWRCTSGSRRPWRPTCCPGWE